jgi:hypothetical protein
LFAIRVEAAQHLFQVVFETPAKEMFDEEKFATPYAFADGAHDLRVCLSTCIN